MKYIFMADFYFEITTDYCYSWLLIWRLSDSWFGFQSFHSTEHWQRPHTGGNEVFIENNSMWHTIYFWTASSDAYSSLHSLRFTCGQPGYGTEGLPTLWKQVSPPCGPRPAEINLWMISFPTERNKQTDLPLSLHLHFTPFCQFVDGHRRPAFRNGSFCFSSPLMRIKCFSLFSKWAEGLLLASIHRSRAVYSWPYSYGNLKALRSNGSNKRMKVARWYDGHGHSGEDSFETNDLKQRRHSHYKLEPRVENSKK